MKILNIKCKFMLDTIILQLRYFYILIYQIGTAQRKITFKIDQKSVQNYLSLHLQLFQNFGKIKIIQKKFILYTKIKFIKNFQKKNLTNIFKIFLINLEMRNSSHNVELLLTKTGILLKFKTILELLFILLQLQF